MDLSSPKLIFIWFYIHQITLHITRPHDMGCIYQSISLGFLAKQTPLWVLSALCASTWKTLKAYWFFMLWAWSMPEDHELFVVNVRKHLVITSVLATFSTTELTKLTEYVRRRTKNWKTIVTWGYPLEMAESHLKASNQKSGSPLYGVGKECFVSLCDEPKI